MHNSMRGPSPLPPAGRTRTDGMVRMGLGWAGAELGAGLVLAGAELGVGLGWAGKEWNEMLHHLQVTPECGECDDKTVRSNLAAQLQSVVDHRFFH